MVGKTETTEFKSSVRFLLYVLIIKKTKLVQNIFSSCCPLHSDFLDMFFLQEMVRRGEILDDSMEDEFYLRRLDAGLFVLQLICYIMVEISNSGISQVHKHTLTQRFGFVLLGLAQNK